MKLQVRAALRYGQDFRLEVDQAIPLDGVTGLFGRSGCGKTSLLRLIAGLERVPGAEVRFGDQTWQADRRFVPLHRRRIGLVFQEHSLLPHLSVQQNLLYGYQRTPESLRRLHLPEVTGMLGIEDLLGRRIDQLSGGQRQRISLGRALLSSPQLLLLDEPMAALDTQTKREIMPFLSRLAAASGVPIIMVSHSPEEIQRLADRVVFMSAGRIERIETLAEAMARPDSPLFEDGGAASIFEGRLGEVDAQGARAFGSEQARLWVYGGGSATSSGTTRLRILARDVSLSLVDPQQISIQNHLPVTIERIDPANLGRVLVACRTADSQLLLAEVTPRAVEQLELAPGKAVFALIKSVALLGP